MAINYDSVIGEMRAAGLLVEALEVGSGKTRRVKVEGEREKRGWYRLSEILIDGEYYLVGAYGIWHGNDNGKVSVRPGRRVTMTPEQRAAINARIKADQAKAAAEREIQAERASAEATKVWRQYAPTGESDYLARKGVGAYGVRFHASGTIAIPMMDPRGKVWGLQIVRGRDRGNKLEKQFWPAGLVLAGHYHMIGGTPRGVTLLCEGYATGASLHEATGLPVVVAFTANNLLPVAQAISKHYKTLRILVCADDDFASKGNPGQQAAASAALAVSGAVVAPVFTDPVQVDLRARVAAQVDWAASDCKAQAGRALSGHAKATDFNDLHAIEGLQAVRAQVEAAIAGNDWGARVSSARRPSSEGGGGSDAPMVARLSVDDAVARYWGTYGMGGKVLFDEVERRLVHKDDVLNLLPRHGWENMREHPDWRVARDTEIGFDPAETDPNIRCNLFGGWPTEPVAGDCSNLLDLLEYLCSGETCEGSLLDWVLNWLAYPLQHRGAKMHSAIVVHGPQGTGKSLFFESYARIFGHYGRILGQEALEDKFNADWAEKKLFILADEILARAELFHIKNRLKSFITGEWIRVNPKGVAAHNERNHMNIVFLSNERQALVLEEDDRRHCVIWSPPKLPASFFKAITDEIANGGIAALHHYLLERDLGDFTVATPPPMTSSKRDLIEQSTSSEDRFVRDWINLDAYASDGSVLPLCPCLGTDLYRAYQYWCDIHGERRRRMQDLIGHCNKRDQWTAGRSERTWLSFQDRSYRNRKMVVPSDADMAAALTRCDSGEQARHMRERFETKTEWLTSGYFAFNQAMQVAL